MCFNVAHVLSIYLLCQHILCLQILKQVAPTGNSAPTIMWVKKTGPHRLHRVLKTPLPSPILFFAACCLMKGKDWASHEALNVIVATRGMTTNSNMNGRIRIKVELVSLLMCGLKWRAMMMRKRLLVLGGSSWSETDNLRLSSGLTLLAHPVLQPGIMFNFFSIVLLTQFFYGTYTGTHFWYIIFPVPVPVLFSVQIFFQILPQKNWKFLRYHS